MQYAYYVDKCWRKNVPIRSKQDDINTLSIQECCVDGFDTVAIDMGVEKLLSKVKDDASEDGNHRGASQDTVSSHDDVNEDAVGVKSRYGVNEDTVVSIQIWRRYGVNQQDSVTV